MTAAVAQPMASFKMPGQPDGDLETLIEPFRGTKQPAASRVVTDVAQVTPKAMTVADIWRYFAFLGVQASALTQAFVSHHLFGPPKPSWGIEMTLFTTAMRASVDFSMLSNVQRMRRVLNLGAILPTPKDGIVTPLTFRCKVRGLKGFLAEPDSREDGKRELTGEWVVSKRLWRKMQEQHRRASKGAPDIEHRKDRVIYYLHGGAYYVMSPASHRFLTVLVSRHTECRVFALDYRLAPETIFPGALHDAVLGYFRLIYDLKIPPENIIFGGDSAGGGLALALMLYLRDNDYPLPSGAFVMSPWCDLSMSCESWDTNSRFDYLPRPADDDHMNPVKCYLGKDIEKHITHPYASPLFGDFKGLPPLFVQCGDAEVLRDESVLMGYKASSAGVYVEHEIYEDCPHVFQAFTFLQSSSDALRSIRRWVRRTLPAHQAKAAQAIDESKLDAEVMGDAHALREHLKLDPKTMPASPGSQPSEDDDDKPSGTSSDSEEDAGQNAALKEQSATLQPGSTDSGRFNAHKSPSGLRMSSGLSSQGASPSSLKRPVNHHRRSHTEAYGSLPLRLRSSSHPDIRSLVDKLSESGDGMSNAMLRREGARSRTNSHTSMSRNNSHTEMARQGSSLRGSRQGSRQASRANSRHGSEDEGEADFAEFRSRRR